MAFLQRSRFVVFFVSSCAFFFVYVAWTLSKNFNPSEDAILPHLEFIPARPSVTENKFLNGLPLETFALPGNELQLCSRKIANMSSFNRPNTSSTAQLHDMADMMLAEKDGGIGSFEVVVTALAIDEPVLKPQLSQALFHNPSKTRYFSVIEPQVIRDERIPVLTCFRDAALDPKGRVSSGDYWIVPNYCKPQQSIITAKEITFARTSSPVFTISLPWGKSYFHQVLERLSRLAEYYDELIQRHDILIHLLKADDLDEWMEFIGIEKSRLIQGHIESPVVYLPRPTMCSKYGSYAIFKLRGILQKKLLEHFRGELPTRGKHILLIKRSGSSRSISNYQSLLRRLRTTFPKERIVEFRDDPSPNLVTALRMFYEAKLVIGPHGAGFTNLIAANEGTGVIEFHTKEPNLCYRRMARMLGMSYEGMITVKSKDHNSPITVDTAFAMDMVRRRLNDFMNFSSP